MVLVPITVKVEHLEFIPVMQHLRDMPGVVDVIFNIDEIGGGKRRPKTPTNGQAPQPALPSGKKGGAGGLKALIVGFLFQGPQHLRALKDIATRNGFKPSSLNSVLDDLRKNQVTENAGSRGMHKLTETAKAGLQAQEVPTPRKALPAPPDAAAPVRNKDSTTNLILRAMQAAPEGRMTRSALCSLLEGEGHSPRSVDGVLYRAKHDGYLSGEGDGNWKLTAKGRRLELPPVI